MGFFVYAISCFGLGALHALEPGHGKTVVGAYLVGSRGRSIDAVVLGIVVTMSHTSIVLILGVASAFAATYFAPETVHEVLELVSGILIVSVGIWMIFVRIKKFGIDHTHNHGYTPGHSHDLPKSTDSLKLGSLIALGISGGIVPCPAALAVLLAAVNLGQIVQGIGLVIIFSIGMASVLVAIGIALVKATSFAERFFKWRGWINYIPIVSACIITLLGIALTIKALMH